MLNPSSVTYPDIFPDESIKTYLDRSISLIVAMVKTVTNEDINTVIRGIELFCHTKEEVSITLDINPRYRAVVFGRQFSNISCLRKMISNLSGLHGSTFIRLETLN